MGEVSDEAWIALIEAVKRSDVGELITITNSAFRDAGIEQHEAQLCLERAAELGMVARESVVEFTRQKPDIRFE